MRAIKLLITAIVLIGFTASCTPVSTVVSSISRGMRVHSQDRTAGGAVDDIIIETTVNHRFFRADVNDLFKNVDVDVIEGRAFLTGNVNRHETMVRAVNLAWEVTSVREVINELQVENTSDIVDAARDIWVELQIEGELLITQGIRSSNYNIETVNGIVILMGVAQNDAELEKVTQIIARTANVKQVVSHAIMVDDPRRITPRADKPVVDGAYPASNNQPYDMNDSYDD